MGKTKQASKWDIEHCPACSKPMNVCREEDGLYYCPDCLIHTKNGVVKTVNYDGDFSELAHIKPELKLVDKNLSEEKPQPQSIDFYFNSGDKKCFRDVIGSEPRDGWIILTKANGKEISINVRNVNYLEEI